MRTRYDNIDLVFSMEGYTFRALNIVFEQFQRAIPKHSHSDGSYEIHYIPYGHGEVVLNGEKHDLSENALYVTGPHVEHEQFSDPHNPMAEYCIYLRAVREHGDRAEHAAAAAGQDRLVRLFLDKPLWIGTDTQNLRPVMQQLFAELESRRTGYLSEVESLLRQCIIRMVRNYERPEDAGPQTASAIDLFNSKSIILEECFLYEYNTLTLEILANRLGLSRRQTERLLKDQYGKTFQQKRTEARRSAATVLLRSSVRSISDISDQLGYSSVEHFSNAFRKYWDMGPRDFRTKYSRT